MRGDAAQEQPQAACGDVVHAQHREDQHARQQVEAHRDNPQATERGIDHQVEALAAERHFPRERRAIRDMRPDESVKNRQRPEERADMQLGEYRCDAEDADAETDHAQAIDARGETLPFACISIGAQRGPRMWAVRWDAAVVRVTGAAGDAYDRSALRRLFFHGWAPPRPAIIVSDASFGQRRCCCRRPGRSFRPLSGFPRAPLKPGY